MGSVSSAVNIYGETIKSQQLCGLCLAETRYAPGLKVAEHSHENAYFSLVLEGSFNGIYGRKAQEYKPLHAVFHPAHELHSVHFQQAGARIFSIELQSNFLESTVEIFPLLERATHPSAGGLAWLAFRLYRETHEIDDVSALAVESLLLEMVAAASDSSIQGKECYIPRWLKWVREIIDANYSDRLTIDEIAKTVGVHPVHLATTFRKHYRCTIGEYIRQLRIEYSCRNLFLSNQSLVDIALAAGFYDQSHFSRTFKKLTGQTPARFRAPFKANQ